MMKTNKIIWIICTFLFMNLTNAQELSPTKEINNQIWKLFTKAFETSDVELFGNIHSKDLIRVGGDNEIIRNWADYINIYKNNWKNALNQKRTIHFRFLERINNGEAASERGIYKLTIDPNTDQETSYYGKFHVILRKEMGTWKILVDYDSSENNTIDEGTYMNAKPLE